jgi:hypothetical protein
MTSLRETSSPGVTGHHKKRNNKELRDLSLSLTKEEINECPVEKRVHFFLLK